MRHFLAGILMVLPANASAQSPDNAPVGAAVPAQSVLPVEWRDAQGLENAVGDLVARHPRKVSRSTIGTTFAKRPIELLTLSSDLSTADRRPAILVVAGMDGERWATTEAALVAVESLASADPGILGDVTVYVVPRANPDAAETARATPRRAYSGNSIHHDNDRDGTIDEDSPRDLDGDGVITQLRARGMSAPWPAPSLVADPAEPRLLRTADAATGQSPEWTVWTEGIDTDGDGLIAEDWPGGIDPERNFPHRWPEFEDEAGQYPLFAPESHAIAEFVMRRPNLFAAFVLGRHDTMVTIPDAKAKTSGGMPAMLDEQDLPPYEDAAKAWRTISGQKRADGRDSSGSLVAWLNAQRGIPAFATTLWGRPDAPAPAAGAAEASAGPAAPKPADSESAAWLEYSDRVRGGAGFVPWKKVEHPQLADAEVGGWVTGFRENPPVDELPALGRACASFVAELSARRPSVTLDRPRVKQLGPGLWRIDAEVRNSGRLPTVMRGGRAPGNFPAHTVTVSPEVTQFQAGRRVEVIRGLDPGQSRKLSWIVAVPDRSAFGLNLLYNGVRVAGWTVRGGEVSEAAP